MLVLLSGCSERAGDPRAPAPAGSDAATSSAPVPAAGAGGSGGSGRSSSARPDPFRDPDDSSTATGQPDAAAVDPGSLPLVTCRQGAPGTGAALEAAVASRVSGTNGEFSDHCDPGGNLIEFSCEQRTECEGRIPNPGCNQFQTGAVRAALVDCAGRCLAGACSTACPSTGDTIVYEQADGAGLFLVRNEAGSERYTCTVAFDSDLDDYDCTTGPRTGQRARIDRANGGPSGDCRAELSLALVAEGTSPGPNGVQCSLSCRHGTDVVPAAAASAAASACPAAGEPAMAASPGSPAEARSFTGSNGAHADACSADGNLIDRHCGVLSRSQGPPWSVYTGTVGTRRYDCGGTCRDGACRTSCPEAGHALEFESAVQDQHVRVKNPAEGRSYSCALAWDEPTDDFDCRTLGPAVAAAIAPHPRAPAALCLVELPELPVAVTGEPEGCPACAHCWLSCRVTP